MNELNLDMEKISVCLVGDSKTGKTCFLNYLLDKRFNNLNKTTIGVDCNTVSFDKERIYWKVYDTSGNPDFITITRQYLKSHDFYLLFFNLNDRYTFDNLEYWISLIENKANILLVGNKFINKETLLNQLSHLEISKLCNKYNITYMELSLKNDDNINEVVSFVNNSNNRKIQNNIVNNYDYLKLEEEKTVKKCCGCIIL